MSEVPFGKWGEIVGPLFGARSKLCAVSIRVRPLGMMKVIKLSAKRCTQRCNEVGKLIAENEMEKNHITIFFCCASIN